MAEDSRQQYADAVTAFDAYYGFLHEMYGRQYPAKQYAAHRMWKKFITAGERCRENGWDIESYVRTVLSYCKKESPAITPSDIVGPEKEQLFIAHIRALEPDPPAKVWDSNQRALIKLQVATGQGDIDVLKSPLHVQFPAWFRVFYPEHVDNAMLETWGQDALDEMRANREIVRFLRATVPGKLIEAENTLGVVDGI